MSDSKELDLPTEVTEQGISHKATTSGGRKPSRQGLIPAASGILFGIGTLLTPALASAQTRSPEFTAVTPFEDPNNQTSNHLLDHIDMRPLFQGFQMASWYETDLNYMLPDEFIQLVMDHSQELDDGGWAFYSKSTRGRFNKVVTNKKGIVVYKEAFIDDLTIKPTTVGDFDILKGEKPEVIPVAEFGPDKVKLVYLQAGIALVGSQNSDISKVQVDKIEGFLPQKSMIDFGAQAWSTENLEANMAKDN